MSRVGREPILIPKGVTIETKGGELKVVGPKGSLSIILRPEIKAEIKDNQLLITRQKNGWIDRSLHGVTRSLIANMIEGVTQAFSKTLKIVGTGYRVKLEGENLVLTLGFSHPVSIKPPAGIKFLVEGSDTIKIEGIDKTKVGEVAAKIRHIRPPEPYKGKGIRYLDEVVRHKAGKAAKAGAVGGEQK